MGLSHAKYLNRLDASNQSALPGCSNSQNDLHLSFPCHQKPMKEDLWWMIANFSARFPKNLPNFRSRRSCHLHSFSLLWSVIVAHTRLEIYKIPLTMKDSSIFGTNCRISFTFRGFVFISVNGRRWELSFGFPNIRWSLPSRFISVLNKKNRILIFGLKFKTDRLFQACSRPLYWFHWWMNHRLWAVHLILRP